MEKSLADQGSPILVLARQLRHAERARSERIDWPVKLYDGATHQRLDSATEFLRALQKADAEWVSDSQQALQAYRERLEADWD
jgi:hypothetical protein